MLFKTISSPVGPLTLTERDGALCGLEFGETSSGKTAVSGDCPLFAQTEKELSEYFAGKRKVFTVPLSLSGTAFRLKVWKALTDIPYGETRSYADIAKAVGKNKKPDQTLVGFAAETDNVEKNAQSKLTKQNLDMIVANDVTKPGAGFNVDTNIAALITADGIEEEPLQTKRQLAEKILDKILEIRNRI